MQRHSLKSKLKWNKKYFWFEMLLKCLKSDWYESWPIKNEDEFL